MSESNIHLSFNCSEKWNKMGITNDGRYCHQCHQNVKDFTSVSLEELQIEKSVECGRYAPLQVSNPYKDWRDSYIAAYQHLRLNKRRSSINYYVLLPLIVCIALFSRCIMGKRTSINSVDAYKGKESKTETLKPSEKVEEKKK